MCGICGITYYGESAGNRPSENTLARMVDAIRHRGPDAHGVYIDGPVGLGSSRLSIMDPAARANQPMVIEGGQYAISFNGEIYNHVELRDMLEAEGVVFDTSSDTEVLLRLYASRGGPGCLELLRGMFAFAVWDRGRGEMFLARDRVGEKPLVYFDGEGVFAFASEIKSLLAFEAVPREPDPEGIHMGLHYVNVPAPYSAFKHIRKLPPAHYMRVTARGASLHRYWQPQHDKASIIRDPAEAVHEIRQCLKETVAMLCRSDVPVGATLSGGIDSSAVVAEMGRGLGSGFKTFCVSHDMGGTDPEFRAARAVARSVGTAHMESVFRKEDLSTVRDVIRSFDEPVNTYVPLHARMLAGFIAGHVKVALTGNGGDELFGGYSDHSALVRLEKKLALWKRLDHWGVGKVAGAFFKDSHRKYSGLAAVPANRLATELHLRGVQEFYSEIYGEKMKPVARAADVAAPYASAFDDYGATGLVDGFLAQQLFVASQHSIVDIPDNTGMAFSLEYRSPFLDMKMVELAMRISPELKVSTGGGASGGKMILREALAGVLPERIVGMKKAGFGS
ncbi:MAG: asparagine synthase (glutamine-hydrolyzing), partial [Thermodesulfovibrionales bacterium]|nr:asparagine synthase (glutamine-hydrolyzing) [Thermodesulfovibrionales bacterium]